MYKKVLFISVAILSLLSVETFADKKKTCDTWNDFQRNKKDNVLLDFSYAGYKHGEVEAPDVSTLGYKVFNVVDFGAVANDEISDRQAFIDAVAAAKKNGSGIVFFPEGRFIIHDQSDDVNGCSFPIEISMDNLIIKGADRNKSVIVMKTPNNPTDPKKMWTSPVMIMIKHNRGLSELTDISGDAKKGSFSVKVNSTKGIKVGDWVCLSLKNNDPKLVENEVAPYELMDNMKQLKNEGVTVSDYHQVVELTDDEVTFKEPIMYAVESKWGWKLSKFYAYTNVGIEDLTFEGDCKEDFKHHASWQDDGAYKPINMMRLTNSWMRRVTFRNVSEAMSVIFCANVSVYDIDIVGRRGHSAIRSQASSRVFIGKILDNTSGRMYNGSGNRENAGQLHACGVSKQSLGAVLWNVSWGDDACFESHSTQPRATLIDNCTGGFMNGRAGGALDQMPNHLADLTMWNFKSTTPNVKNFEWWETDYMWMKFLPVVMVGFHGEPTTFSKEQLKREDSNGTKVYPESLYEAQLERRLGYLPDWIKNLK